VLKGLLKFDEPSQQGHERQQTQQGQQGKNRQDQQEHCGQQEMEQQQQQQQLQQQRQSRDLPDVCVLAEVIYGSDPGVWEALISSLRSLCDNQTVILQVCGRGR